MQSTITFNKIGYDPFIDFLKAYCILVVVFCHGFPYLYEIGYAIWGVQIPLFFLIQVFHCYKREPKPINWSMIAKRIIIPFVIIELLVMGVLFLRGGRNGMQLLKEGIMSGGYGPGSYYPWIYLQMAILIPFFRPICERLGKWKSLLLFILLSVIIEILCSLTHLPDFVYRLLCIRYLFLMWLGLMWVNEGIKLNHTTIIVSLLSLYSIFYLAYFSGDNEPWIYNTGWATHRWICYFWVSWLFVRILHRVYRWFMKSEAVWKVVSKLSLASYEIFLMQMAYYAIVPMSLFSFIGQKFLQFALWFVLAFVLSIGCGVILYRTEIKIYFVPLQHRVKNCIQGSKNTI